MFIQTEETPNPNSIKFVPGEVVLGDTTDPVHFSSVRDAYYSPLATSLFTVPEVSAVFLGSDFITITKGDDSNWEIIKPEILTIIMDHFVSDRSVIDTSVKLDVNKEHVGYDSEIVEQIKELIETQVRPAVAQDGGDIVFVDFVNGVVKLKLRGACSGCPSASITLKNGIENMLKHYIPEVLSVESVDD